MAWNGTSVDYDTLYQWSIDHPERLWPALWRYFRLVADERPGRDPWDEVVVGLERMAPPDPVLGPRWFLGARLNFAENLLRFDDDREALVSWDESGRRGALTYAELNRAVAAVASALRAQGIRSGDRVAGFLPNIPEAIVAMLATASLGAIWSSCSPDFGVKGVLDRFGQITPRVLFAADGYRYGGKEIDSLERVREIVDQLPSIESVVVIPWLRPAPVFGAIRAAVGWGDFTRSQAT
ncbi:partial acetoacetyl-CoA synthetase, partial [Rhodocyclaceae bacterium]